MTTADRPLWRYEADFVPDADRVFAAVRDEVTWTEQMASRQTASMGIPYNYAGASYPEAPWHPRVWAVAELVAARFGFVPTNCLLNRYRTGLHSMGWHADDVSILAPETGIVIVSLGAPRTLSLRAAGQRDELHEFTYEHVRLAPGSVLHMTQALQATHKHGIKREKGADERISLTFRHLVVASSVVDVAQW